MFDYSNPMKIHYVDKKQSRPLHRMLEEASVDRRRSGSGLFLSFLVYSVDSLEVCNFEALLNSLLCRCIP